MSDHTRRSVLRIGVLGTVTSLSGCSALTDSDPTSPSNPTEDTRTTTRSNTETQTPQENLNEIFVDAGRGSESGSGTRDDPVGSIRQGIQRAEPGQTVTVAPGEYPVRKPLTTVRSGTAEEPIVIRGSEDAVVRPADSMRNPRALFRLEHDHIRLLGLSLDGLRRSGDEIEIKDYGPNELVLCQPPSDSNEYLNDIVIKPATVGHAKRAMIVIKRSENVEVGEFEVTGMAGAHYVLTDRENLHAGEIVYIGTPPTDYGKENYYEWTEIDQTSDVHVHHIDNSAGHAHSELANTKLGTHDVLVEYCTDGGGSQNTEPYPPATIHFQSYDATVRWCRLLGGDGYGVHINSGAEGYLEEVDDPPISRETAGTGHAVYGNEIRGLGAEPLAFSVADPDNQELLCGNTIVGTESTATRECPSNVPGEEGIGHLGGSSPWGDQ